MKKIVKAWIWILYAISFLVTPIAIIWQMANEHANEIGNYIDKD